MAFLGGQLTFRVSCQPRPPTYRLPWRAEHAAARGLGLLSTIGSSGPWLHPTHLLVSLGLGQGRPVPPYRAVWGARCGARGWFSSHVVSGPTAWTFGAAFYRVSPGVDLIAAFYGCLYCGCVPVTVRPPHPQNLATTLPTVKMIVEVGGRRGLSVVGLSAVCSRALSQLCPQPCALQVSKSACVLTTQAIMRLLRSKEAAATVDARTWPTILDTGVCVLRLGPALSFLCCRDCVVTTQILKLDEGA